MDITKGLIKELSKGNKKVQLAFYREVFSTLMGVAVRYKSNSDDATVLVNDAFIKILMNMESYSLQTPFEPWARRVIINCAIDDFRKTKRQHEVFEERDDLGEHEKPIALNDVETIVSMEAVEEFLKCLPERTKLVFNLHKFDGYAHREIAAMLSITEQTSKWHVKEARKKLKAHYDSAIGQQILLAKAV